MNLWLSPVIKSTFFLSCHHNIIFDDSIIVLAGIIIILFLPKKIQNHIYHIFFSRWSWYYRYNWRFVVACVRWYGRNIIIIDYSMSFFFVSLYICNSIRQISELSLLLLFHTAYLNGLMIDILIFFLKVIPPQWCNNKAVWRIWYGSKFFNKIINKSILHVKNNE